MMKAFPVPQSPTPSRVRWLVDVLAISSAYIAAALLRFAFPFTEHGASWVWLPSGVAVAALLLLGWNRWPAISIGGFAASILNDHQWGPAFVAACYTPGEALLAYAIITYRAPFDRSLGTVSSVLRLLLGAFVSSLLTSVIGAWNVSTLRPLPDPDYARAWLTFFVGDWLGILAVAPPLLVWGGARVHFAPARRRIEFAALLASAFLVGVMLFASTWPPMSSLPVAYATFPIMVWAAFRFGQPGVTGATVVLGALALSGSARGLGPFAHATHLGEALMVAGFTSVIAITAIILAAVVQERARAGLALRASEDRYRSVVELAGSPIVMLDGHNKIVAFNRAAGAFYGLPPAAAIGQDFIERLVPAGERNQVRADLGHARAGHAVRDRETRMTAADGTTRSFLWNASSLAHGDNGTTGILVIGQDISELRRLETQLLLSQRMEGIGRLAGGIAHDFNNLLTAILGHAELARTDVAPGDPAHGNIAEITRAAQRAADLTRQLLAFARRQIIEPRIVDMNGLVLNVDKMLRRLLGEDVELVTHADPSLWRVRIDPGQFEQVLVNLVVNARDAMPDGGRLVIETRNVVLDPEFARHHATVQPGEHVLLAVTDTGTGMDADVLAHIFEPFFTTKDVGKGTGLGLATCYGIVKQNRGSIWVYSERGKGTVFKIYFPRADAPLDTRDAHEPRRPESVRGNETVLLVEDEPVVRTLAADALTRHGFQVLTASTGAEALELSTRNVHPFDVLVTDVVMPQMGGQQLAERMLARTPSLKVLFISGYTDTVLMGDGILKPGMTLLQKPFTPGQLVQRVRDLLDLSQPPA